VTSSPSPPGFHRRFAIPSTLAALTLGLSAFTTVLALTAYRDFRTGWPWDLAYYNQWFWTIVFGDGVLSVRPISAYSDEGPWAWKTNYLAPVRLLILPIYRAFPDPRTLLVVENVVFWWVVPAAYSLLKSEAGSRRVALAGTLLVPLTPLVWPLALNDFRELQLALPFVLWGVQGVRSRDLRVTAVGVGGMLACRQEFAAVVASLALLPPRRPEDAGRSYRWAHGLVVLGAGWFLFAFFGYLRLTGETNGPQKYLDQFAGSRAGLGETLTTASEFVFLGLGVWGIFLLRAPRLALPMLPWLWSLSAGRWSLRYLGTGEWHHVRYAAPMVALGLAAGLVGFGRTAEGLRRRFGPRSLIVLTAASALLSAGPLASVLRQLDKRPRPIGPAEAGAVRRWVSQVAPDDGVLAGYEVTAPLSTRRHLYSYRLDVNRPKGYPELPPTLRWLFLVNADAEAQRVPTTGFEEVHRGPAVRILRRTVGASK